VKVSDLIYQLARFPKDMQVKIAVDRRMMDDFVVIKCFNKDTNIASAVILTESKGENIMKTFAFEVAHGFKILRCVAGAESKEIVIDAIKNGTFEDLEGFDCIDTFDTEILTVDYELLDIWE